MRFKITKAMVLAAGYGTRLKPLTDRVPKPLVPVGGKPMIEYALEKLRAYGIQEIVVNVSHLKHQLIRHLAAVRDLKILISEEDEPLETGGGLRRALPLLGNAPFFVINSDIIWADAGLTALERLTQAWDGSRMDILLLAQSKAQAVGYETGEDHVFVTPQNTIGWDATKAPYIIAGVTVMHPRLLQSAPDGRFSIKILWRQALSHGRLYCLPHLGSWMQTGTLADIAKADRLLFRPLSDEGPGREHSGA